MCLPNRRSVLYGFGLCTFQIQEFVGTPEILCRVCELHLTGRQSRLKPVMARLVERQKNDWFIPEWAISLLHLNPNSQMICFSAQAVGYSLIWHRARQKSGVHSSGEEGPGDELSQAHESPHLQQAEHGKNRSKNVIFLFHSKQQHT